MSFCMLFTFVIMTLFNNKASDLGPFDLGLRHATNIILSIVVVDFNYHFDDKFFKTCNNNNSNNIINHLDFCSVYIHTNSVISHFA